MQLIVDPPAQNPPENEDSDDEAVDQTETNVDNIWEVCTTTTLHHFQLVCASTISESIENFPALFAK